MSNFSKLSPDDPRLTAFALGELEGEELAAVEAALRDDPAARAAVDEIRALAGTLQTALAAEPLPEAVPAAPSPARAAILPGRDPAKLDGGSMGRVLEFPKLRFPQLYYIVGGLAAAAFAFLVVLRGPQAASEKKTYTELRLQARAPETVVTNAFVNQPATVAMDKAEAAAPVGRRDEAIAAAAKPSPAEAPYFPATKQMAELSGASGLSTVNQSYFANEQRRQKDEAAARALQASAMSKAARAPVPSPAPSLMGAMAVSDVQPQEMAHYSVAVTADSAKLKAPANPAAEPNTEAYAYVRDNDFLGARENPLSTFSADVDTASYANVRRMLAEGRLPPPDAVRIEELVNYFPYHYAQPTAVPAGQDAPAVPFAASLEVSDAPWAPGHRLVRIGLKGREVSTAARAAANLVFLLDVSGSMDEPNKLPLVKESMRLLLGKLRPDDRVAIVVYAGASGLALPSTPVKQSREILAALDSLEPGGSTNGAMGIQLAYDIAKANFVTGGINRVILCTDGDFNVGVTSEGDLTRLISEKAKSGVFLTVLGFGMGNYKDATLEKLADQGNGNYGYIDSRREAQKLLVEQVGGTLVTIAKDVKLQVEFNPAQVASYRLIGYENRLLKKEDFNNDAVDAGEIGAGHTVTALYEIVPASQVRGEGSGVMGAPSVDPLKYAAVSEQRSAVSPADDKAESRKLKADGTVSSELLTLKVRYKEPAGAVSRKLEFPLVDRGARFAEASADFRFAAAVAEFGMILRGSPHKGAATLDDVKAWAEAGTDDDAGGYRSEFIELVKQAQALMR